MYHVFPAALCWTLANRLPVTWDDGSKRGTIGQLGLNAVGKPGHICVVKCDILASCCTVNNGMVWKERKAPAFGGSMNQEFALPVG